MGSSTCSGVGILPTLGGDDLLSTVAIVARTGPGLS